MSLIVTSNIALEDRPETSEAFKPYSYQNRLLNTFKIPPNSEIALQSAKINKNGLFVVDRANSGFAHYFGAERDEDDENLDESTTQPFPAVIGAGEAFRAGGKTELNVDDMADEINKGLNRSTFHPSLIIGSDNTGITVVPKYASSGLSFEGFKFTFSQQTAKTTRNAANITWTDVSKNNQYNFTQAGGTVTSTDSNGFYVQNREYPISQNNGTAVFDFSDANTGHWMVGLSRINTQRDNALGGFDYLPNYFNTEVGQALLQGVYKKEQFTYADIAVVRQGQNLRVYQSGARTAVGNGDGIYMNEVEYYGGYNASFNAIYNVGTNSENYDKVKFELVNEELKIYMEGPDGEGGTNSHLLADFTTLSGAGAVKNQCLNPTNAAKWALYPVCAASGGNGKEITLDSVDHYTNYPTYAVPNYINYDWWGYSQFNNLTRWCKELEMRDWNNYNRTTSGSLGNGLLTPKGVNADGGMDDYQNILITARSNVYGDEITANCNTANTLGFVGMPISQPSSPSPTNLQTIVESNSVPKLISNVSLFIRLNNFTQNSINARQGTNSKIIAHLPRFDNSGNETGGLFFQGDKTYLKLNNTEELLVNSFDIDIVYDNETLCTALTGKTIVVFHIRDAK